MAMSDSLVMNIVITVSAVLTFLYLYYDRKFKYWKNKNVPFIKPVPIFGNYASVMTFRTSFGEMYKTFYDMFPNEKFFGLFGGHESVLCIRDPELIKHVMTKDFYYFSSRGLLPSNAKSEPLDRNLFHTSGDDWKVLRQNLTPLFSSAKLRNMFYLITECTKDFELFLKKVVEKNNEMDVCELMPKFTTDVIGSCAFGLQMNSINETDNIFRVMGKKIFEFNYVKSSKVLIKMLIPSLFELFNLRLFDKKVERFFIDLVRRISESRDEKKELRHDFIDLMMELKKKGSITGTGMSSYINKESRQVKIEVDDELMAAQSFIFFAAGFETSSTTMSYALYELAKNKIVQVRAQGEIDRVLKKHGNQLTYEAVKEMTYIDMIISETLRKYPVLGVLTREVTEKYKIPDTDIVIDKGVKVIIPLRGIQHDPIYYPNPEVFDPERFTPEEFNNRHPYTYMPFGEGPRICIGLRFGKMQSIAGLVTVLKSFSVEQTNRTEAVLSIDPRSYLYSYIVYRVTVIPFLAVTTAKNGIWVRLVSRKCS